MRSLLHLIVNSPNELLFLIRSISSGVRIESPRLASQPTKVILGSPDSTTILAASGSYQMLNSATGDAFPSPRPAEPMIVILPAFATAS